MLKEDVRVGQKVIFGRENGEQTLGKVLKKNPKSAKIEALENRGDHGSRIWRVAYSLLRPAVASDEPREQPTKPPAMAYSPFSKMENLLMEAILFVYFGLSPENLTGDGELPRWRIQAQLAEYKRQLKGLFLALGREVSEEEAYEWDKQRRKYDQHQFDALKENLDRQR